MLLTSTSGLPTKRDISILPQSRLRKETTMKTVTTASVTRNQFGALVDYRYNPASETALAIETGKAVLKLAISKSLLPAEYVTGDGRRGEALNYDVYDVSGATALVQQRTTTWSKYGNSPIKEYFLLRKVGRGVVVEIVENKATVNKAAKASETLGEAIAKARVGAKVIAPAPKMANEAGLNAAKTLKASLKKQYANLRFSDVKICRNNARALKFCATGIQAWCVETGIETECITLSQMFRAYAISPVREAKLVIEYVVRAHCAKL